MAGSEDHAAALLSRLTVSRSCEYLYQPIPSDLDADVAAVTEAYRAAGPDGQASMRAEVAAGTADILECFAERQAVVAVRTHSQEPIRQGLLALGNVLASTRRA